MRSCWTRYIALLFLLAILASCHGGASGSLDTTPPAVPSNLTALSASSNSIYLAWTASTDNTAVAGYKVYRDGTYLNSTQTTTITDTGLSASTQYCYTVSAYNTAGNDSGQSSQTCAKTWTISGSLDKQFGSDGIVVIDANGWLKGALLIQQDGMILDVGNTFDGTNSNIVVARYGSSGRLDPAFGAAGKANVTVSGCVTLGGAVLQPDGKVVVAGSDWNGSHSDIVIVRFDQNGILDPTFGADGVYVSQTATSQSAEAVAIQNGGMIVIAGFAENANGDLDFLVARYTTSGAQDPYFGSQGAVTTPLGLSGGVYRGAIFYAVAIASDGSIIATGMGEIDYQTSSYGVLAVARYLPDGSPDITFGQQGLVLSGDSCNFPQDMKLQGDGKIVVAAFQAFVNTEQQCLMRFEQDGQPDSSFGLNGTVFTMAFSQALAIQSDGKILTAGQVSQDGRGLFALARFTSDGTVDGTFGNAGLVITDFGYSTAWSWANAMALQPDGKIVTCGIIHPENSFVFNIERFLP